MLTRDASLTVIVASGWSTGTWAEASVAAAICRSARPKVSRVSEGGDQCPISAYRLNSSAGPTQPNLTYSRVVTNGVNPDTMAEIW